MAAVAALAVAVAVARGDAVSFRGNKQNISNKKVFNTLQQL